MSEGSDLTDVPARPPRRRPAPVSPDQVRFFASLIRELAAGWQRYPGPPFRDLPEYTRLIEGAYACGFVDPRTSPRPDNLPRYTAETEGLRTVSFGVLRSFIYAIFRSERWGDAGEERGGGAIYPALRSGALEIVAERLERFANPWS